MTTRQRILLFLIVLLIGSSMLGYALGSLFENEKKVCVSSSTVAHDEYGNVVIESTPTECHRE